MIQSQYWTTMLRSVAELGVQRVDRRLVGERAEDVAADVAGQHLGADEDDDAEDEQRDDAEQDPA